MIIDDDDLLYRVEDGAYLYDGEPFTGIAQGHTSDGALVSEIAYVNGVQEGLARHWYPSGGLLSEEHYLNNSAHGPSREWYENGQLKRDSEYEHAVLVREMAWDENGALTEDFVLSEGDPMFKTLQDFREIYRMYHPK